MSLSDRATLAREADLCVAVATPEPFHGVGAWYRDFSQLSDEDVLALLDQWCHDHPEEARLAF